MNSKLNSVLFEYGFNKQKHGQSLYLKLSGSIMRAILNKQLVKGSKLPPTRLLSKDLGLSRSTVIKAYEVLCLEKYITAKQGSGYIVNDVQHKKIEYSLKAVNRKQANPRVSKRAKQFRKHVNLMNRGEHKGIAFRPGLPPLDVFPVRKWQNLANNYWKEITFSEMSYGAPLGLDVLRKNIVDYLRIYRNIQCDYQQVVIVTGSLHSLSIVGDLLIDKGDPVVVENPTYANAIAIFKSLGAKILTAPVDNEGLNVNHIKNTGSKAPKLVYTTPSNQYPSGIRMTLGRRLELLGWAGERNCLIVEDDYDHEFSNWEKPISSIFGLDKSNCVIYQGTFNKLLHPAVRLGYLVVPPYLVEDIRALYEQSLRFVSPAIQKVMSSFIEKDYLSKHLRKVVEISNERRVCFTRHFNQHFGKDIQLHPVSGGLHVIAQLPSHINDVDASIFLERHGIVAFPYSKYFLDGQKENGLVMGFSSVREPMIIEKIQKMARLFPGLN